MESAGGDGMKLERCDICDELTGNAGALDDSIQCEICGRYVCVDCLSNDVPMDMSCGYTPTVCKLCALEQVRED